MPRTTTIECPGCPPLRAFTFDALGLIKVIEARSKENGVTKVVERWGEPDSSQCVLAASIDDSKTDPLLAVARKNGVIECLSPVNGDLCFSISDTDVGSSPEDDQISGLHLLKKLRLQSPSRSCTIFTCTTKGKASMRKVEIPISKGDDVTFAAPQSWTVCGSGDICCSKVSGDEVYSVFGGKGVEVNMWDLEKTRKIWSAKSPPKNSLGIFNSTWFTSLTFLSQDDHRKVVAGTNSHQVRLYDISAQRRPVLSVDFRDTPIKSVAEDLDGHTIYLGNGSGDLASIDIRTGKLLGCFIGKCAGSVRSIARHPEHSVIASCGLDSYLRIWDTKSRQLLSAVFLKQHLTSVLFDSNFSDEEPTITTADPPQEEVENTAQNQNDNDNDVRQVKRKKSRNEGSGGKKLKSKTKTKAKAEVSDDL